jgi:hypothetical protein
VTSTGLPNCRERYSDNCARSAIIASGSLSGFRATTTFERVIGAAAEICTIIPNTASTATISFTESFIMDIRVIPTETESHIKPAFSVRARASQCAARENAPKGG